MKTLLQKINIRLIVRCVTIALMGMQIALLVIFLTAGLMTQASSAFSLCIWMFLALLFESKAHNLKGEKQGKTLKDYKSNKPSRF
jgi:hypothetical protein